MARSAAEELLQPSLLDRLTDDAPGETRDAADAQFLSMRRLRAAVLRDLDWLLNTARLSGVVDLTPYKFVQESVLNYGVPSLVGRTARELDALRFEREVKEAIKRFEPRVLSRSLKVRWTDDPRHHEGTIVTLEIDGEVWAVPVPEHVVLRSRINLEGGQTELEVMTTGERR